MSIATARSGSLSKSDSIGFSLRSSGGSRGRAITSSTRARSEPRNRSVASSPGHSRLLESGKLFESDLGTSGGEGPEGQLTLERARPEETTTDEPTDDGDGAEPEAADPGADADPPVPPAPRRSGSGSGRGVGEVVVRALDPRLRSAMVVEDGVRRIVINSRYPLFEVRRGDLWYQLETALREVCVTIPEATAPEFERKVNELMLVSLSLTGRSGRRRSAPATRRQAKGAWAR